MSYRSETILSGELSEDRDRKKKQSIKSNTHEQPSAPTADQ